MAESLALGTRVRFTHYLRRIERGTDSNWARRDKVWVPIPVGGSVKPGFFNGPPLSYGPSTLDQPHVDGIIVGSRTLQNGVRVWVGEDEGYRWDGTEMVEAYLVAWHMRRAIAKVWADRLEVLS